MRPGLSASSAVCLVAAFLAAMGWCRIDWAQDVQLPRSRQGNRTVPILLLSRTDIQNELSLSPEVAAAAKTLAGELRRKASALHGKTGAGILMARRAIDDQQTQWLNKNLSQTQLDRLHQIDLQWEGPAAFVSRPIIADYLKLSTQQRREIAHIVADRADRSKQPQTPQISEAAFVQLILTKLSDEQRKQWRSLQGNPFQFQTDPRVEDARLSPAAAEKSN
jgi:hypothetical protein